MNQLRPCRFLAACAAVLGLANLSAGADLFVGAGYPFAEVNDAIAAAAPGDRIFVAPGSYVGFDLSKPVEIRGAGVGVTKIGTFSSSAATVVSGIPAGTTATLSDMSFDPAWFLTLTFEPQITVIDNAGTVVLQNVRTNTAPTAWHISAGVFAKNTTRLVIQGSTLKGISSAGFGTSGAAGLVAESSLLDVSDSVLIATGSSADFASAGAPGAYVEDCAARFARVQSTGGSASSDEFSAAPGGAGVKLVNSTLVLAGGPANKLKGAFGAVAGGPGLDVTAGSAATVAADAVLEGGTNGDGSGLAPGLGIELGSTATTLAHNLPALVPGQQQVTIGTPFTLEHSGEPGALVVPAFSGALGPALSIGGLDGLVHLDLTLVVPLPSVVLGGTGLGTSAGVVPSLPTLLGAHAWFQAAEIAGGAIRLSNPMRIEIKH